MAGEKKFVSRSRWPPGLGESNQQPARTLGVLYPCHLGFEPLTVADMVLMSWPCEINGKETANFWNLLHLRDSEQLQQVLISWLSIPAIWVLCHLGPVRTTCNISWQKIRG